MPKKIDVRITTIVVAYTSLRLGHVTRAVSLRTSERKRAERPHHPATPPFARPAIDSSCSTIAVFIISVALRSGVTFQNRGKTGRTGGNRTPNPRFWRPVLCQLSYCPNEKLSA